MQLDDPANLHFRAQRRPRRPMSQPSSWKWWVFALIAAVTFVLIIRALLARTAGTAGPSPQATSAPAPVTPAPARRVEYLPMPTPMVYRCEDAAGAVAFQSHPCGAGQRTTKAIPAPPDREPGRRPLTRLSPPPGASGTSWSGADQGNLQRTAARARCAAARSHRESTLRAVGLKRTYDLLQRLDAMVRETCKGT